MNVLTLLPTEDSVNKLIQLGEGLQVEFLTAIPSPTALAQIISAFANTEGGVILTGVAETPPHIRGINWQDMGRVFDRATENLKNIDNTILHQVRVNDKLVGYLVVKKSPTIVIGPAGAYQRVGEKIRPMTANQIEALIPAPPAVQTDLEPLIQAIAALTNTINNQTGTIQELQGQVSFAQSFKGQWKTILFTSILSFFIVSVHGIAR